MIASALALLLMQVGPNPAQGAFPGIPEELRDRPVRDQAATPPSARMAMPPMIQRVRRPPVSDL